MQAHTRERVSVERFNTWLRSRHLGNDSAAWHSHVIIVDNSVKTKTVPHSLSQGLSHTHFRYRLIVFIMIDVYEESQQRCHVSDACRTHTRARGHALHANLHFHSHLTHHYNYHDSISKRIIIFLKQLFTYEVGVGSGCNTRPVNLFECLIQ